MADIAHLIDRLIAAHRSGRRIAAPPLPLTRADILRIQAEVAHALGAVAGFKVGHAGDGAPILAPIPARYVVENGGRRPVADRLGIELELGFELLRPLPERAFPDRPEAYFRPCVALELVDTRLDGPLADDPQFKFADLQINAGLVQGGTLEGWDGADFGTLRARLAGGETVLLDGETSVPGGSALANLELLVASLGDHCGGLQPGQVVITGSVCGLPWFGAGTDISGEIEGLGRVSVSLV